MNFSNLQNWFTVREIRSVVAQGGGIEHKKVDTREFWGSVTLSCLAQIVITSMHWLPKFILLNPQNGCILSNVNYFSVKLIVYTCTEDYGQILFLHCPIVSKWKSGIKIPRKAFSDTASALLIIDHELHDCKYNVCNCRITEWYTWN